MSIKDKVLICVTMGAIFAVSGAAAAVTLDNGFATTTQGYWSVVVNDGGESRTAYLTATGQPSGTVFEAEEIVYDYFSYVDTGSGGVQLSATNVTTPVSQGGAGTATSAGTFQGAAGNTIMWSMTSTIEPGSSVMTNVLTLTAETGTLGLIDFYQYLDEDVLGSGDDFFFKRGSFGSDLELFTIDYDEAIGVSHSGAQGAAQGLVNAVNLGWAMCDYNSMKPNIAAGTQTVSPSGEICGYMQGLAANHPIAGPGNGPEDIVSAMAWSVDPQAATATIVTTIGGVPDIRQVDGNNGGPYVPVPLLDARMLALLVLLLGGAGAWFMQRRRPTT
jgi:hypothetical protein